MTRENSLWIEKYRPDTLDGYIGNAHIKEKFARYIAEKDIPHLLLTGPAGTGKAQPYDSKVLTPDGWVTMGDIRPGFHVVTPDGMSAKVLAVFDHASRPIIEIEFFDGRVVRCCEDHLWKAYGYHTPNRMTWDVVSTTRLRSIWLRATKKVGIPLTTAVQYEDAELPLHPYVLGALIGDAYLPDDNSSVRFTSADTDIVEGIAALLPTNCEIKKAGKSKYGYNILGADIGQGKQGAYLNRVKYILNSLGLLGKCAWEKHIPERYKVASEHQRWELIRGLFDTDGTVGRTGDVSFTTTSEQLARDVQEIIWSLGGIAKISTRRTKYPYKGEMRVGRIAYKVSVRHPSPKNLFSITRKLRKLSSEYQYKDTLKLRIVDIRSVAPEPCKCILINHPEHLYLTDGYVVTHNTTAAKILLKHIPCDTLILNASDDNNIDTVRSKIRSFVATQGFSPLKIVFLDEFDGFSYQGQGALRNLMEQFSRHSRFILTANYVQRIIEPILSRTQLVEVIPPSKRDVAMHLAKVLKAEGVSFEVADVKLLIDSHFPDIRKVLGEAQFYTQGDKLVLNKTQLIESDVKLKILAALSEKASKTVKLTNVRQLVANATMRDFTDVYRLLFENVDKLAPGAESMAIIAIAEGQYRDGSVVDKELNFAAMIVNLLETI
jgi:DNA polymerase III delta prime subunit